MGTEFLEFEGGTDEDGVGKAGVVYSVSETVLLHAGIEIVV